MVEAASSVITLPRESPDPYAWILESSAMSISLLIFLKFMRSLLFRFICCIVPESITYFVLLWSVQDLVSSALAYTIDAFGVSDLLLLLAFFLSHSLAMMS